MCDVTKSIRFMDKQWLTKVAFHSRKYRFHICSFLDAKIEDFFPDFLQKTIFFSRLKVKKKQLKQPQHSVKCRNQAFSMTQSCIGTYYPR